MTDSQLAKQWREHVVSCQQCLFAQAGFDEYCKLGTELTLAGGRVAAEKGL